ncbi:hypothetical protein D9611_010136 [Ephemerocybe angulata]|uniref:Uncharacterized protein n=1 Tax=Ephemerocybe angulata TaxID=980116 RepID=A0A8H5AYU9_9AGAR|nr:hypothetical protein D9611_010136 [Tulosesus angulatus]
MTHEVQANRRVLDRNKDDGGYGTGKETRERDEGGVTEAHPAIHADVVAVMSSTLWEFYKVELLRMLMRRSGAPASRSFGDKDFAFAWWRALARQREVEGKNDLRNELARPLGLLWQRDLLDLLGYSEMDPAPSEERQQYIITGWVDEHVDLMAERAQKWADKASCDAVAEPARTTSTAARMELPAAIPIAPLDTTTMPSSLQPPSIVVGTPTISTATPCRGPLATPTALPPPPRQAPLREPTSQVEQAPPTPLVSARSLAIMQANIARAQQLGIWTFGADDTAHLIALMKGEMDIESVPVLSLALQPEHCQQRPMQAPCTLARNKPTASVTSAGSDLDSDTIDEMPRSGAPSTPVFVQTEVFMHIDQCTPQDRIHPHARPPEHQYPASDEYDDAEPEPLHRHQHPPDHQHPAFDEYSDTEPDPIHLHARPPERDHPTPSMNHDYEPDRIHLHARPPEDDYPIPDNFDYSEPDYYHPPDDYQDDRDNTCPRPVYDSEDDYEMGVEPNLRDAYEEGYGDGVSVGYSEGSGEGYEEGYEDGSTADCAESGVYESSEDASDLSELDEPHGYSGDEDYGDDGSASGEHSYYDSDE